MGNEMKDDKYMGPVKVGPKGQIVIPKEVRALFGIQPGDTLMLLADKEKGIAIERYEVFQKIADAIFSGRGREIYPDHEEQESLAFAQKIRQTAPMDQHKEEKENG